MLFPQVFQRTTVGGVVWTADALPAVVGGQQAAPNFGQTVSGAAPTNGQIDNGLAVPKRDLNGAPVYRVAVSYTFVGSGTPQQYLSADLYVYDRATNLYLKTDARSRSLRLSRITYFDVPAMNSMPMTSTNMLSGSGSPDTGNMELVLLVTPPTVVNNGTYQFGMGVVLTSPGAILPQADDEAIGAQVAVYNDTPATSLPYGPCRWLWCNDSTGTNHVDILTVDGDTVVIPCSIGKIPFAAKAVKAATTAVAGKVLAIY